MSGSGKRTNGGRADIKIKNYEKGATYGYGSHTAKKRRTYKPGTTREQSHSAESNTRLTLIALLGALGFAGVFAALALRESVSSAAFVPLLTGSIIALAASLLLFAGFRR
ncbi:MAG: hypothetical protein IKZ81_06085 [Clostridia bacterium]|nr:hypothetical protein [Clostridia bacterium]MBR5942898.1 hypothetical protein [Clostridia bacterium]